MAARHWVGGGAPNAGDWQQANNWVEGFVPVAADEVYFDRGTQDVDQGLNNGAVNLDLMYVSSKYSGSIGAVGTPLLLDQIDDFYYAGLGDEAWFNTSDAVNGINNAVIANSGTGADAVHLDGLISRLDVIKGVVNVDGGANAPAIYVGYVGSPASDATVTIGAACTLGVIHQCAGTITNSSNLTNLFLSGVGIYNHGAVTDTNTLATANIYGGTCNYYSTGAMATGVLAMAGTFTAAPSRGPLTIAIIYMYKDSIVSLANGQLNITVTNGVYNYGGGTFRADHGQRVNVVVL